MKSGPIIAGALMLGWLLPPVGITAETTTGGRPALTVDAATRAHLGITVATVEAIDVPQTVHGTGRLLDPAPFVTAWYDVAAARVAFSAADVEYRRVQSLARDDSNASRRDLETAQTALEQARGAQAAAEARFVGVWGQAGAQPELATLVEKLVRREATVARIELPLDGQSPATRAVARLRALAGTTHEDVTATVMTEAPDADPTIQGRGILLVVARPPWPSGTAVEGWVPLPGPSRRQTDVPAAALLRDAGATVVYVQVTDDGFARRVVHLEAPSHDGWLVSDGLDGGERLVVTGAQALLSIDRGGAAEEE